MLAGSAAQDRTGGRTDAMCLCHCGLDTDDMVINVARHTLTLPVHPNCAMFHIQGDTLTLKMKVHFLSTVGKKVIFKSVFSGQRGGKVESVPWPHPLFSSWCWREISGQHGE